MTPQQNREWDAWIDGGKIGNAPEWRSTPFLTLFHAIMDVIKEEAVKSQSLLALAPSLDDLTPAVKLPTLDNSKMAKRTRWSF
jgi:hypothetical protein